MENNWAELDMFECLVILFLSAAMKGDLLKIQELIEMHADIMFVKDKNNMTAFLVAAANNRVELVKWFLSNGHAEINTSNKFGFTALLLAALKGHTELVAWLLEKGSANINEMTEFNMTPFMLAAAQGHIVSVEYFTKKYNADCFGSDQLRCKCGLTAFLHAAKNGHTVVVQYILDSNPTSILDTNPDKWDALMYAASNGHLQIFVYLLRNGVSLCLNTRDRNGWTVMMLAAANGHLHILQFLLGHLESNDFLKLTKMINNNHSTAFLVAAEKGHLSTVQFLMQCGGSTMTESNKMNQNGWNLLSNYKFKETKLNLACMKYILLHCVPPPNLSFQSSAFQNLIEETEKTSGSPLAAGSNQMTVIAAWEEMKNGKTRPAYEHFVDHVFH